MLKTALSRGDVGLDYIFLRQNMSKHGRDVLIMHMYMHMHNTCTHACVRTRTHKHTYTQVHICVCGFCNGKLFIEMSISPVFEQMDHSLKPAVRGKTDCDGIQFFLLPQ